MTRTVTTRSAPGWLPVLGHAVQLARDPLRFLTSLPTRGDVVRIRLGPWPAYVVCDPDLVHRVLVDDRTFDKGGPFIDAFRAVVGDGLGVCPHQEHRRRRRMLQPAFHRERLADYAAVMTDRIAGTIDVWRDGQVVDIPSAMHELTMAVVTRTLFAARTSAHDITEIRLHLDAILRGVARRVMLPVPGLDRIPTPGNLRFAQARRRVRQLTGRLIDNYRQEGIDYGDVLSLLLATHDDDGARLTEAEIHDEVIQFFLAGVEAMPALLSWVWLLLDRHPDVRARLHAEVDAVLADRVARYDDLPRLEITARIVSEALRLYPPAWLITRRTTAATVLAGHDIPTGAIVVYSPYLAGRRADNYPDPARFDPDRWRTTPPARGTFVPFGSGARKCAGDSLALALAVLTVASTAARWRLHVVPKARVDPVARGLLAPRSLPMLAHLRSAHPPQQTDEVR